MRTKKIDPARLRLTLLALPFVAFIIAFSYVPVHGWLYSLFDYRPALPLFDNEFVGLANFKTIIDDMRNTGRVLGNTLIFFGLDILTSVVPVILAILLSEVRSRKFKKLVQTTTTLPYFISWIIIFSFAFNLFSFDGLVNQIITAFNPDAVPSSVLINKDVVYQFQTALRLWKNAGWSAIVYLAAIAGIDSELYDAASVDGAGRMRKILHITLPGVAPTFFVLLILSISSMLSSGLDQYLVFYNSIVASKLEVLDYYVYKIGLMRSDYSYAIAVGISKTFISLLLLFSANWLAKKVRGASII
ncbi:MAG: ABC transporter permease subunit [Clostridiales bacterium]|jgi:ABC-type polysaccharide transport system permease subunit|nr:ABC transporter permease subunit [Clostridiales bacterium]